MTELLPVMSEMPNRSIAHYALRADLVAGLVEWSAPRKPTATFRLPGCPDHADLPELGALTVVNTVLAGRGPTSVKLFVLTATDGGLLGRFQPMPPAAFDSVWPAGRLSLVGAWGVAYEQVSPSTMREVDRLFPGAAPYWRWVTFPHNWLMIMLCLLAMIAVVAVLVAL